MIRLSRYTRCTGRLWCRLVLALRLGGRNRNGQERAGLQGVRWRQVIGCDDVAFRNMVLPCNLSERLAALDDDERRDRGTGGPRGAWAIARRSGGRRNIRTFPARGQEGTAAQYQRRDQCPVQIHRSRSPAT